MTAWAQWLSWDWTAAGPVLRGGAGEAVRHAILGARGEVLTGAGASEEIEEAHVSEKALRDAGGDVLRDTAGEEIEAP